MKTIAVPNGFINMPDIEAICPNCKQEVKYLQKDILTKDVHYKICRGCKKKVGISIDFRGDTVTWLKENEKYNL